MLSRCTKTYKLLFATYIVDPLIKEYNITGVNYLQPLSAQAQQARKINRSSAL